MRTWLREIRTSKKMLQREIAHLVEINQSYYTYIENGKRRPSVETAKKIAAVLNFDWTMFYEDKASRKVRGYTQLRLDEVVHQQPPP